MNSPVVTIVLLVVAFVFGVVSLVRALRLRAHGKPYSVVLNQAIGGLVVAVAIAIVLPRFLR